MANNKNEIKNRLFPQIFGSYEINEDETRQKNLWHLPEGKDYLIQLFSTSDNEWENINVINQTGYFLTIQQANVKITQVEIKSRIIRVSRYLSDGNYVICEIL
jgi:hypothetical protein